MEMRVRSCSRFRPLVNCACSAPQCSGHPARELRPLRVRALLRPQRPSSHGARVTLNWNAAGFLERRAPSGLTVSTR